MIRKPEPRLKGRGTATNIKGRFNSLLLVRDNPSSIPEETEYFSDQSQTILTRNDSPDIGYEFSINPYRGCEHGCVYCYARPYHEFLGLSAGLDFESKIFVKHNAPGLLEKRLSSGSWQPQTIALSGVTDPYQPTERKLKLTRACLQVLSEFRNPVSIVTKNTLVTRDIDYLAVLAAFDAVEVGLSITSLNSRLQRILEPRTSAPQRRLRAVEELRQAGIRVKVLIAPVIPGLNDYEIPKLVEACAEAGAMACHFMFLRLPQGVEALFKEWLDVYFPERKDKILNRLLQIRGGNLSESRFFKRMQGEGIYAEQITKLFEQACFKAGLNRNLPSLSAEAFSRPSDRQQLRLF